MKFGVHADSPEEILVNRASLRAPANSSTGGIESVDAEKLAGRQSLGIDRPTEINLSGSLELVGPWLQSPPKDFSKPELRWFSWGFEQQALFVAKIRRSQAAPANIRVRGQACTETICKNIDVALPVPRINIQANVMAADIDLKTLVPLR